MSRQRYSIALIVFLFATAFGALMAFLTGLSDGARAQYAPAADRIALSHLDATEPVWDCNSFGGGPGLPSNMAERVCGEKISRRSRPCTPLRRALAQTIADDALAGGPSSGSRAPDFFAPEALDGAPDMRLASADDLRAPTIIGSPMNPFLLVGGSPGGPGGPGPGNPIDPTDPTDPTGPPIDPPGEVPLPGALPFMATGLAGFFLARRRKRRA